MKAVLEAGGITAVVRGEYLTSGWGELPLDVCSVWIADESQYERAQSLVLGFLRGDAAREFHDHAWRCARCGESLEGQFNACWNCGASRP